MARRLTDILCFTAFVFCGRTLNDDCNLREQGVRSGVTIHVMKKPRTKSESKHAAVELPLTEEKMKQVTAVYKRLWVGILNSLSHTVH